MDTMSGMIVGCYTLDLYCAVDHSKLGQEYYNTHTASFTGRNEIECLKRARKAGWIVNSVNVLCPQHHESRGKV